VAKLSLLLCYYGENNLSSTLFKICTEFNKTVCVPVQPQRIISATLATRRKEYLAEDYLSTVFASSFVMKTHVQKKCQQVSLLRNQIKEVFSSKFFSKQSVETHW